MKKMMKILAAFLICMMMVIPAAAAGEVTAGEVVAESRDRVVDDADLLTDDEEASLEEQFAQISELYQFDLVAVTTYDTDGKSSMEYADDYFDYNGYGYGENYDGALLLVNMEAGEWWVSTCGSGIDIITDDVLDTMSCEFVPYMSDGDFYAAFLEFANQCDCYLAGGSLEDGYIDYTDTGYHQEDMSGVTVTTNSSRDILGIISKLIICLIIGLVAAFIPMSRLKKQMRTVAMKAAAADYVKPGSRKITKSRDAFLYSHVSRVPKPKENKSGGGMSMGGGVHIGSSGRSHGGGGGRF